MSTTAHVTPDVLVMSGVLGALQLTYGDIHTACLIGSIGGAVLAALVMDGGIKARIVRAVASVTAGYMAGPALLVYYSIKDGSYAAAVGSACAFLSWGVLTWGQSAVPAACGAVFEWLKQKWSK